MCSMFGRGLTARRRGAPPALLALLLRKLNRRSTYSLAAVRKCSPTGANVPAAGDGGALRRRRRLSREARGLDARARRQAPRRRPLARPPTSMRRVAEQGADAGAVEQRDRAVRRRARRRVPASNSPRLDPGADHVRHPVAVALVHARRDRAQLRVADRAQPELDPEHPLALLAARVGQALADRRRERRRPRCRCQPARASSPKRSSPACSKEWIRACSSSSSRVEK